MKTNKILPCICCDHTPDCGDSVFYGMPALKISQRIDGELLYTPFCPKCGYESMFQYKSVRKAIIEWNVVMNRMAGIDRRLLGTGEESNE